MYQNTKLVAIPNTNKVIEPRLKATGIETDPRITTPTPTKISTIVLICDRVRFLTMYRNYKYIITIPHAGSLQRKISGVSKKRKTHLRLCSTTEMAIIRHYARIRRYTN